jgi:hypothetical protein
MTRTHVNGKTLSVRKKQRLIGRWVMLMAAWIAGLPSALAVDWSYSGFGTLGYARSDQPYRYQRFIDDEGTLERDSIAGFQIDTRFSNHIGATMQAKLAPAMNSDSAWDATLSWAFLSWRASNDLLIRLGKQRSPAYLYSETMDVGVTYDFARLPPEIYRLVSSNDYLGLSMSNTWTSAWGEWMLDIYGGRMDDVYWRFYQRDHIPTPDGGGEQGVSFQAASYTGGGIILSVLQGRNRYRLGWHRLDAKVESPTWRMPTNQTRVPAASLAPAGLAPDIGGSVYTVLPQDVTDATVNLAIILGVDIQLPRQFRLIGELAYREVEDVNTGIDTKSGYVALLKDMREWTPYLYFAKIQSRSAMLDLYESLNRGKGAVALTPDPQVEAAVNAINASQRVLADSLSVHDQYSIAIGASYRITPKQKVKVEWAHTHVGVASSLIDAPAGGTVSNENMNLFSLSYNLVF